MTLFGPLLGNQWQSSMLEESTSTSISLSNGVAHSLRKCCTSQLSTVTVATSRSLQIAFCVALPNILTAPPGLGSATFFIGLLVTVLEGYEKERMVIEQYHVNVVYMNKKKENVRRRRRKRRRRSTRGVIRTLQNM